MKEEEEVKKEQQEEEEGCPSPSLAGRIGLGGGTRGSAQGWVQLSGKVPVFLFPSEPRKLGALKEVKRAPKKEQGLTCFAFPVAARCLPRQLSRPGPRGAGGGGGRHWGSSQRSLKAQAETQELFSLKSWFVDFTELWN